MAFDKFFRSMERVDRFFREMENRGSEPRLLNNDDLYDFDSAVTRRTAPKNRDQIIKALESKNRFRVHRARRDLRWMEKQLNKMGLNPEDARYLL